MSWSEPAALEMAYTPCAAGSVGERDRVDEEAVFEGVMEKEKGRMFASRSCDWICFLLADICSDDIRSAWDKRKIMLVRGLSWLR